MRSFIMSSILLVGSSVLAAAFPTEVESGVKFVSNEPSTGMSLNKRYIWRGGNNDQCGGSTFYDETSDNSPSMLDCMELARQEREKNGYYEFTEKDVRGIINNSLYTPFRSNGQCAFAVKIRSLYGARIGSSDVADLIVSLIDTNPYRCNGARLGGHGTMGCNPVDSKSYVQASVEWAIIRS